MAYYDERWEYHNDYDNRAYWAEPEDIGDGLTWHKYLGAGSMIGVTTGTDEAFMRRELKEQERWEALTEEEQEAEIAAKYNAFKEGMEKMWKRMESVKEVVMVGRPVSDHILGVSIE